MTATAQGEPAPEPKIWSVSASQLVAWNRCRRYWHFRHVRRMTTPQTPAQERGSGVHKALEHAQLGKQVPTDVQKFIPYLLAAAPYLPPSGTALIEARFEIATYDGGPTWLGFIDRAELWRRPAARIGDNKTTSDFRYNLTPDEITHDVQLMSYAEAAYTGIPVSEKSLDVIMVPPEVPIELGHLYLLTRNKTPTARYVSGTVNRQQVADFWGGELMPRVRELVPARQVQDTLELPPNTESCGMYGGCAYRAQCGLVPRIKSAYRPGEGDNESKNNENKGEKTMAEMSWVERMKAANGITTNGAQEAAPAAPVQAMVVTQPVGEPTGPVSPRDLKVEKLVAMGVPRPMAVEIADKEFPAAPPPVVAAAPPAEPATTVVPPDSAPRDTVDTREATPPKTRGESKKKKAAESTAPAQVPCGMCQLPMAKFGASESYQHPANVPCMRAGMTIARDNALESVPAAAPAPPPPPVNITAAVAERAAASAAQPERRELTLLIGVMVSKQGKQDDDVTMLEDWIAPMCEQVAKANEVPDWRLVKFAQVADGMLASEIRARMSTGNYPSVLVINPSTRAADVAIETLSPYASRIYRGFRG